MIKWSKKATKQVRKFPQEDQANIYRKAQILNDFPACPPNVDIKSLKNHQYQYRLRIGQYRVLFDFAEQVQIIDIQEVKKRDDHTY